MDEQVQRDSEKRSNNPEIPTPGRHDRWHRRGFITDQVDMTGVEPGDATGVDPSEAAPFASDRLFGYGANPTAIISLWNSATRSYMDHQS